MFIDMSDGTIGIVLLDFGDCLSLQAVDIEAKREGLWMRYVY